MISTSSPAPSQKKLWMAAIKPPMYSVAVIPIAVGTAFAYSQSHQFQGKIFSIFLFSAIAILAWLNLSNDVFDADTGIDQNKAHSVVNLTGNKSLIFVLSNLFLLAGLLGIVAISWLQQDSTVILLILLACLLGYSYQGPPFRLGYQGLGEVICFITFGPMAIAAVDYSQSRAFHWTSLTVATLVGISTSIILFCSHFHQVADDLAAGKRSPIVRLGTARGSQVLTISTISFYLLAIGFIFTGLAPWQTGLVLVSIPLAWQLVRHVQQYHDQPQVVNNCKFLAVNFHFVSGMLLALGYLLAGLPNT